jgi:hypothetical protein
MILQSEASLYRVPKRTQGSSEFLELLAMDRETQMHPGQIPPQTQALEDERDSCLMDDSAMVPAI